MQLFNGNPGLTKHPLSNIRGLIQEGVLRFCRQHALMHSGMVYPWANGPLFMFFLRIDEGNHTVEPLFYGFWLSQKSPWEATCQVQCCCKTTQCSSGSPFATFLFFSPGVVAFKTHQAETLGKCYKTESTCSVSPGIVTSPLVGTLPPAGEVLQGCFKNRPCGPKPKGIFFVHAVCRDQSSCMCQRF